MTARRAASGGFTLVELMIAVTIVAILSALAWPSYSSVLQRAQRNDARLALYSLQFQLERHYFSRLGYAGATVPALSSGRDYALSVTTSEDGQHYTATASVLPDRRQRRDRECQQFSIDETGQRRSADATGAWTDDPRRCWE